MGQYLPYRNKPSIRSEISHLYSHFAFSSDLRAGVARYGFNQVLTAKGIGIVHWMLICAESARVFFQACLARESEGRAHALANRLRKVERRLLRERSRQPRVVLPA